MTDMLRVKIASPEVNTLLRKRVYVLIIVP